jgi:hypothetical protein
MATRRMRRRAGVVAPAPARVRTTNSTRDAGRVHGWCVPADTSTRPIGRRRDAPTTTSYAGASAMGSRPTLLKFVRERGAQVVTGLCISFS